MMAHAWEALCWTAFGIGCLGMLLARIWMREAARSLKAGTQAYVDALTAKLAAKAIAAGSRQQTSEETKP